MSGELPGLTPEYLDPTTQIEQALEYVKTTRDAVLSLGTTLAEDYLRGYLPIPPEKTPAYQAAIARRDAAEKHVGNLAIMRCNAAKGNNAA